MAAKKRGSQKTSRRGARVRKHLMLDAETWERVQKLVEDGAFETPGAAIDEAVAQFVVSGMLGFGSGKDRVRVYLTRE